MRLTYDAFQLFSDVGPDLAILEEGIQLDGLHVLLLLKAELMQIEAHTVEAGKDNLSQVKLQIVSRESATLGLVF